MLIAVDFDGTIVRDCLPNKPRPEDLLPNAREVLTELHQAGHRLVLWTLRDPGMGGRFTPALDCAVEFLDEQGLGFIRLARAEWGNPLAWKPCVDLFIEDKIPGGFIGWDQIRWHILGGIREGSVRP